ncbi:DinB family protein [Burkholderiaceae bacterium DAT-1]|nr:DinB family protein [Burkholderiaceae bacterium DAT-1]
MSVSSLFSLFQYKNWANRELLSLMATVPDAQADARHQAIRFLNHIYVVDRIFQAHLQAVPHGYDATNTKETPALAELDAAVSEVDAWYLAYVQSLSEASLAEPVTFEFTDGDRGTLTREEMLLHIITHGGYHRGNVGQILRGMGMAPPRDIYTRFLHQAEPQRRSPDAGK